METNDNKDVKKRYDDAVESFVRKVKNDPNIIAVFLAGSLAYDTVWEKSDVDLSIIVRDQTLGTKSYCVDEDDIVVNLALYTRSDFKKMIGRSKSGGFAHSYFSKGKFIYTADESLNEFLEEFKQMGRDDVELSFFLSASMLIGVAEKIEKWLKVKDNPLYAQYYILKAADLMSDMKMCLLNQIPTRESVLNIMELEPEFIRPFYEIPLSRKLTREEVAETLALIENFLEDNLEMISRPAIEYMEDGQVKTVTELVRHFGMDSHGLVHTFEFLTKMGVIEKVSQTIRITPKGRKSVEEVAFVYLNVNI